jgi:restriction system protein
MNVGDWVVVPNGTKGTIHIAEITSDYVFDPKATEKPFHYRNVKWIKTAIPRTDFDPDLLYSFGGQSTIYLPKAKDAELRVKELAGKGRPERVVPVPVENGDEPPGVDYELLARDQITNLIIRKYKGHELERFVEAILIARGYVTHRSPTGPDKGVDILAAAGPLGFANPRICVQVKATEGPVDAPTLNQLIGTMQNVKADQGLLVSWGGFTKAVEKERAAQFFHVRLWDREALIDEFLGVYDKLDAEIRAEIPIKQIWSIAAQDDDEE